MKRVFRRTMLTVAVAAAVVIGLFGDFDPFRGGLVYVFSEAQAVIGRPLTPMSYAGVARRTMRRCAVGVYYC